MRHRLKTILVYFGILEDKAVAERLEAGPHEVREALISALALAIILGALAGIGALGGHPVDEDEIATIIALVGGALLAGLGRAAWSRRRGRRPPD
jgi:hypothetical protein